MSEYSVKGDRLQTIHTFRVKVFHFISFQFSLIVPPRFPPCLIRAVLRIRHWQSVANARGRRVKVHGLIQELHKGSYM